MYSWHITNPELEKHLARARRERAEAVAAIFRHAAKRIANLVRLGQRSAASVVRSIGIRLARGHRRRTMIGELMALDDRALKDIGLNRAAIHGLVNDLLDAPPRSLAATTCSATAGVASLGATQAANDNASKLAA